MKINVKVERGGCVAKCAEFGVEVWRVPRYLAVGACMAGVLKTLAKGRTVHYFSASAARIMGGMQGPDRLFYERGLEAVAQDALGYNGGPLTGILAVWFEIEGED